MAATVKLPAVPAVTGEGKPLTLKVLAPRATTVSVTWSPPPPWYEMAKVAKPKLMSVPSG